MRKLARFMVLATLLFTASAVVSAQGTPVHIDLLYVDNCPDFMTTWNDLAVALSETGIAATVSLVYVGNIEQADALHFPGSPTVKINGGDLEGYQGPGALGCRVYQENGGRGYPSMELLTRRLLAAAASAMVAPR